MADDPASSAFRGRGATGSWDSGATGTWDHDPRGWHPLTSSNLAAFQYDPRDMVLRVRFTSGREYAYEDVPKDVVDGLETAESAGKYFNANIKNTYKQPWK